MIDLYKNQLLRMRKSGNVYNLHSYWTKQPTEIIENFITQFSKENEIVLDCFAGTGMTAVAAKKTGRKSILYDISPICCHISKGYTNKIMANERLKQEFDKFKEYMEAKFKDFLYLNYEGNRKRIKYILYSRDYKCPKCNEVFNTFEKEVSFLRKKEEQIYDECPQCGFSDYKQYIPLDIKMREITLNSSPIKMRVKPDEWILDRINKIKTNQFPKEEFFGKEPKRNFKYGIKYVYQLYTPYNLMMLQEIIEYINKIQDLEIKDIFLFVFTSILFNCSILSAYTKYENTVYRTGTYYIPKIIKDNNPLDSFYSKFEIITRTLKRLYTLNAPVKIYNKSALNMDEIKDESIDFIYIDPPYSDCINYSELNLVWESWLGLKADYNEEIIVNGHHGKSLESYAEKMNQIFTELFRVLKKDRYLTLIFHHPKPEHWRSIQKAIFKNNFILVNKKPIQIRSNSKTHSQINTKKTVQGFLALVFRKGEASNKLVEVSNSEFQQIISNLKQQANSEGFNTRADIYDYIITELFPRYKIKEFIV